jgi:hypothetical protein
MSRIRIRRTRAGMFTRRVKRTPSTSRTHDVSPPPNLKAPVDRLSGKPWKALRTSGDPHASAVGRPGAECMGRQSHDRCA